MHIIISPLGWPDAINMIEVEHIKGVKSPDDEQVTKKKQRRGSAVFFYKWHFDDAPSGPSGAMKDESLDIIRWHIG